MDGWMEDFANNDFAVTFSLTDTNLSILMLYVLSSCQHVVLPDAV